MVNNKLLYYIDGYHGGVRGHMPPGCWRDILEMLKKCPEWKLCIDVEPISFDALRERDPLAYEELRVLFSDTSLHSRLEMVSASYGQCYGYLTDGESNIRHLLMGLEKIQEHFPDVKVTTFAVQEPCWTSALPQILLSLGFQRAVLKNPSTAWGGYCEGFDDEIFYWEGPDGSRIPTAPRYACEELLKAWETESVNAEIAFAEKCIAKGIAHPTGMIFQDLGWPAFPRLGGDPRQGTPTLPDHVQHTTWQEYFADVAAAPEKVRRITQESFLCALPWGERLLVRMARQVRRGEGLMLSAERLQAMDLLLSGKNQGLDRLKEAWHHLLMAQHHDGWICASMGEHEENWAWKGSAQIYAAESLAKPVMQQSLTDIISTLPRDAKSDIPSESLLVVNPLAKDEERLIEADITCFPGTKAVRVLDGDRELAAQLTAERHFADGSVNAGKLRFVATLPAFGIKTFRLEASCEEAAKNTPVSARIEGNRVLLESDRYHICLDLAKGGAITSLFDKHLGQEIAACRDGKYFNEYSGFFIEDNAFRSSTEHTATAEILENGPVRAAVRIAGRVGNVPFTEDIAIALHELAIPLSVTFRFPEKTYIGEPHTITPPDNKEERHRSYHDSRYKLCVHFPTAFRQQKLFKDAAYDVCESRLPDTHFKRWDEIKHNILLGWADVNDGCQGLALMTDHTTSYTHGPDTPLALTLAWGWDGGYWWGRRQLKGSHTVCYTLLPHEGSWQEGHVWHEYQKMQHTPLTRRSPGQLSAQCVNLIRTSGDLEVSAVYARPDGTIALRLFNPGNESEFTVTMPARLIRACSMTELEGKAIASLPIDASGDEARMRINMPPFGIRTLLITPAMAFPG